MYESPFFPRILYGGDRSDLPTCAAMGINVMLIGNFHHVSDSEKEAYLAEAESYGIKLMPWFLGFGGQSDIHYDSGQSYEWNLEHWRRKFIEDFRDDERIYGWYIIDEPEGRSVELMRSFYSFIRTYDPAPGKPCLVTWDQDDAHWGTCSSGEYDLTCMDTWWSGSRDGEVPGDGQGVQRFLACIRYLDGGYRWRQIGRPAIAHFYKFTALEGCYQAWVNFFGEKNIPVVGVMYYKAYGLMTEPGRQADRDAILAFHQAHGWGVAPPETFTIQETTCHEDRSVFRVKVSSVAEHNKILACPVDGTALPLRGVEITGIVAIPLIETLKNEIVLLDQRIAEMQGRIAATRAEIAKTKEILGV